jgi:hypothetical protein
MDSYELRQMSIDNANLALNQMNGMNQSNRRFMQGLITPSDFGWNQLTKEHKEGIKTMMAFFKSHKWEGWMFKVCIGKFSNGEDEWMSMSGSKIFHHLERYFNEGMYGEGGKGILNGIRKCYIERMEYKRKYPGIE